MTTENEELMQKFVRAGMIMRHIDGEEGPKREGRRKGGRGREERARFEMGTDARHPHGPHGHGPHEGACGHEGDGHERHGHRRGQARVIAMIALQEGISQKDLAFLLGIRPQTLGEMLRKLEERGLVERAKSEADGRVIEVSLTDEGRKLAAEIAERRKLAAADLFAVLSDEEKNQLASILDKLTAELEKHRPHHPRKQQEQEA